MIGQEQEARYFHSKEVLMPYRDVGECLDFFVYPNGLSKIFPEVINADTAGISRALLFELLKSLDKEKGAVKDLARSFWDVEKRIKTVAHAFPEDDVKNALKLFCDRGILLKDEKVPNKTIYAFSEPTIEAWRVYKGPHFS